LAGNRIGSRLLSYSTEASTLQATCVKRLVLTIPYVGQHMPASFLQSINTHELERVAQQTFSQSAQSLGAGGNLVALSCSFLCRQGMNTVWFLRGTLALPDYHKKTVKNAVGSVAGVGGSVTGIALGNAIAPGIGTGVGSLLGGFVGSYVAEMCARNLLQINVRAVMDIDTDDWVFEINEQAATASNEDPTSSEQPQEVRTTEVNVQICFEDPPSKSNSSDWLVVEDEDSGCATQTLSGMDRLPQTAVSDSWLVLEGGDCIGSTPGSGAESSPGPCPSSSTVLLL